MTPLRQRMLDALVLRGMAARTQESYIEAVSRLARHYGCSPELLSADEVQQYLLHLVRERHLARASVNQYGCAFRFLYGAVLGLDGQAFQIPLAPQLQRLPQILSRAEVAALLSCAHDPRAYALLSCAYALAVLPHRGSSGRRAFGALAPGQCSFIWRSTPAVALDNCRPMRRRRVDVMRCVRAATLSAPMG